MQANAVACFLQVLEDSSFATRIDRFHAAFIDQPAPTLDVAVHISERIIKARGERRRIAFERRSRSLSLVRVCIRRARRAARPHDARRFTMSPQVWLIIVIVVRPLAGCCRRATAAANKRKFDADGACSRVSQQTIDTFERRSCDEKFRARKFGRHAEQVERPLSPPPPPVTMIHKLPSALPRGGCLDRFAR